jgi:hypothetical protein
MVEVTETHPMKIMQNGEFWNIAARNVKIGDIIEAQDSNSMIQNIEISQGNGRIVYNFEYDLEDIPLINRSIIANGVITLDLLAQKEH